MGGCRCSYRNCSLRTDGKTHMFHYPVFDKVRCHQWLTNAHKLEFLNLKVSQLKNRVVCQHHFKDDNFMNFKKDKLTFEAVPTESGPYCDSSQSDETKTEQEESKVFTISLDDIENEYLTIVDKKANFSVKYGDFLTNCELMDLDSLNSLNQINNNNQIAIKGLSELPANPIVTKDLNPSKRLVKTVQPLTHRKRGKRIGNSSHSILKNTTHKIDTITPSNFTINQDTIVDISKVIETPRTEDQNSSNLIFNVYNVPIEFEGTTSKGKIQENVDKSIDVKVMDESKLLNDQLFGVKAFEGPNLLNEPSFDVKVFDGPKTTKKNADRSLVNECKKIRILSEKKISEPVPLIGKFEPVSPTKILTFPKKKRFFNRNPIADIPEVPVISNKESSLVLTDMSKDNITLETSEIEPLRIISIRRNNVTPPEKRNDVRSIISDEDLSNNEPQKTRNEERNKSRKVSPNMSLLRNKMPPERVAAIAEKRKFNMKLRDIIEDCLDKLDEPGKSDLDKRKLSHKTKIMQSEKQQVGSYLAKDPVLPSIPDYTIAYLEARIKKMEDNLLNKIEENSQKIVELKQTVAPSCNKKNVHTQTSVSEDVHKKQLYQDLSKYLSEEANSLLYEELFINKYTKDVPKGSTAPKRRKCR